MLRHPKPRRYVSAELWPNVHWAQIQRALRGPGLTRSIYDFELIYVFRGELLVHFPETDERAAAGAGDLLLLPSAVQHRIEIVSEPDTLLLGIHFDFYNELSELAEQDIAYLDNCPDPERICSMPASAGELPAFRLLYPSIPLAMVELMERVVSEHAGEAGAAGRDLACRGLMLLIFAGLTGLNGIAAGHPDPHPRYRAAMLELAAEMDRSPGKPWTNADMAGRFNLSEDHFIRLFKEIVGASPGKHVQALRFRDARRLLRETDMTIESIGQLLGYDDLHNFSKAFKKWQGVSPRAYRKLSIMH